MKRLTLFTLMLGAFAAVALAATAAAGDIHWDISHVHGEGPLATLIVGGCDGLVAEGNLNTYPAYTHNFQLVGRINGWVKSSPDVPYDGWSAHYRLNASGTDSAGHAFTADGLLTKDADGGIDFYAPNGSMVVRRDDGSYARGTASWAATSAVFGMTNAIFVFADVCQLR